ncbi:MAG: ribosome silencing factor [Halanaerobiaceae bacterium]|jgi:ribosome-associated protein|nr:ribosome silencing factor [Halanaerobiaceae bacterium]
MDDRKIKEMAVIAAEAAADKKATDIEVLDVRALTTIADYFVICTGNSETQVKAITREIEEKLAEKGIVPQKIAGKQEARWVLLDYGTVIVHVFYKDERDYYELDRLWADAEKLLSNS